MKITKEYIMNNTYFNIWAIKYDDADCHIYCEHIGKSEEYLSKRAMKIHQDATSFFGDNEGQIAVDALLNSEKFAERVVALVESNFYGSIPFVVTCDNVIGHGVGVDGIRFEAVKARFFLSFKGRSYINKHTRMPFKTCLVYPKRS